VTGPARFDEWGLRAAEGLETSVGPWVALASYRRLLDAPEPIGTRALVGAMRCAAALGDDGELEALAERWSRADGAAVTDVPVQLARAQLARGRAAPAAALARAELARRRDARSAYAAARLLEAAGDGSAGAVLRDAQALAVAENDGVVASRCAARRLELLEVAARAAPGAPFRAHALAIAEPIDLEGAEPAAALWIAKARLLAPRRFVRAGALSRLGAIVEQGGTALARPAAFAIARHVDGMGARLTAIEAERAAAGLRALPEGLVRDAALARLAALRAVAAASPGAARDAAMQRAAADDPATHELASRARALAAGPVSVRFGRERFVDPFTRLAALGLEALAAMAQRRGEAAGEALDAAWPLVGPGDAAPAPLWTATVHGLLQRGAARAAAARLGAALVGRAGGEPPGGFRPVGEALVVAGAGEAALEALRRAERGREAGAGEALARAAVAEGWRAHERGDAARARALLVEGRELARGTGDGVAR
jgi:hypothetical protein